MRNICSAKRGLQDTKLDSKLRLLSSKNATLSTAQNARHGPLAPLIFLHMGAGEMDDFEVDNAVSFKAIASRKALERRIRELNTQALKQVGKSEDLFKKLTDIEQQQSAIASSDVAVDKQLEQLERLEGRRASLERLKSAADEAAATAQAELAHRETELDELDAAERREQEQVAREKAAVAEIHSIVADAAGWREDLDEIAATRGTGRKDSLYDTHGAIHNRERLADLEGISGSKECTAQMFLSRSVNGIPVDFYPVFLPTDPAKIAQFFVRQARLDLDRMRAAGLRA